MTLQRKPAWLRIKRQSIAEYGKVSGLISGQCLHTICQSGKCPNQFECWSLGTATFMILGDICTRGCRFCATKTGVPLPPNRQEIERLAATVETMKLKYVVLTSVTRDDLPDGGAGYWADTIRTIQVRCPQVRVEALIPDMQAREEDISTILAAKPYVVAHNLETVRRLTPVIRSKARYETSLKTLQIIHEHGCLCKTGIMLGLGETESEVMELMDDARSAGATILTIGQYLQPSTQHYPVAEYITPAQFESYKQLAYERGFSHVESAPLVRSSYHAERSMTNKNK